MQHNQMRPSITLVSVIRVLVVLGRIDVNRKLHACIFMVTSYETKAKTIMIQYVQYVQYVHIVQYVQRAIDFTHKK